MGYASGEVGDAGGEVGVDFTLNVVINKINYCFIEMLF